MPLQSAQGFTPLLWKANDSSQQMLNSGESQLYLFSFLVSFGLFSGGGGGNDSACSCAGGPFFLKAHGLVLLVLLQTDVSRTSAITAAKLFV